MDREPIAGRCEIIPAVDRTDVEQTAAALRALLADAEEGELPCSPATRNRIEGAALALEQLTAARSGGRPANDP